MGVSRGFHGINLSAFTPLIVTKSDECARLRVREILAHKTDTPYPGKLEYLLTNGPDRWQASMEQVFLTFATIFMVHPEVVTGVFGVAARAARPLPSRVQVKMQSDHAWRAVR